METPFLELDEEIEEDEEANLKSELVSKEAVPPLKAPSMILSHSPQPSSVNNTHLPYFDSSSLIKVDPAFNDRGFHHDGDFTIPPKQLDSKVTTYKISLPLDFHELLLNIEGPFNDDEFNDDADFSIPPKPPDQIGFEFLCSEISESSSYVSHNVFVKIPLPTISFFCLKTIILKNIALEAQSNGIILLKNIASIDQLPYRILRGRISLEEVFEQLKYSRECLSSEEGSNKLEVFGPNKLEEVKDNKILKFLGFMWNPLSWVIEVAAIMDITLANGGGNPPYWQDFFGIIVLLFINSTISFIEENNADNVAYALMAGLAPNAKVLREGKWGEQDAAILVPGDIINIKLKDIFPADARLLEGDPLSVDQSALTGESLSVIKGATQEVFSGSIVNKGEIEPIVYATVVHIFFGKAAHLVYSTNQVGHFQQVLTVTGNFCICLITVGIIIELIVMYLIQHRKYRDRIDNLLVRVIGGIPIAMPTVFSVTMAIGSHKLSQVIRKNISQVITLPSPHHQWSASNTSVAQVGSKTGTSYAWNLGMTSIIIEDTKVDGHVQVSSLNVILPASLSLYITPLSSSGDSLEEIESTPLMTRWYVVYGRQYLIQMKVFAHAHGTQEIYITENDDVKVDDYHSDYWRTIPVSNDIALKHGWRNTKSKILKAYSPGLGKLTPSVNYLGGVDDKKEAITIFQEVMVYDKVKFTLENESVIILLPWAPGVGGCAKTVSSATFLHVATDTVIRNRFFELCVVASLLKELAYKALSISYHFTHGFYKICLGAASLHEVHHALINHYGLSDSMFNVDVLSHSNAVKIKLSKLVCGFQGIIRVCYQEKTHIEYTIYDEMEWLIAWISDGMKFISLTTLRTRLFFKG